jgi:hypothetical protein
MKTETKAFLSIWKKGFVVFVSATIGCRIEFTIYFTLIFGVV